ncbi:hypothetical protein J0H58_28920 [bacterium]|nr:hypothetical protein [bacterium]
MSVGTVWAPGSWADDAWAEGSWADAGESPAHGLLCAAPGTSPALDGTPAVSARLAGAPGVLEC